MFQRILLCCLLAVYGVLASDAIAKGTVEVPLVRRHSTDKVPLRSRLQQVRARKHENSPGISKLEKRAGNITVNVQLNDSFQLIDISLITGYPLVEVILGGQTFSLVADLGSPDLIVFTPDAGSGAAHTFNSNASASFQVVNSTTVTDSFGVGQIQAVIAADTLSIGGQIFQNQQFLLGTATDLNFSNAVLSADVSFNGDGILGLANADPQAGYGFTTNIVASPMLAQPYLQVMSLANPADNETDAAQAASNSTYGIAYGETLISPGHLLTIGGYNASAAGNLTWVPVLQAIGGPAFQLDGVAINGQTLPSTSGPAAVDTGTIGLLLPQSVVSAIASAVGGRLVSFAPLSSGPDILGGSTWLSIPCNATFQLAFNISGQLFDVSTADLLEGTLDEAGTECLTVIEVSGDDFALVSAPLMRIDFVSEEQLGTAFLQNVITVLNFPNNTLSRIGLAVPQGAAFAPASLGATARRNPHAGLLGVDGRSSAAVTGDAPMPSATGGLPGSGNPVSAVGKV